jgi:hypothetical protein
VTILKRELSEAQLNQRRQAAVKHGAFAVHLTVRTPQASRASLVAVLSRASATSNEVVVGSMWALPSARDQTQHITELISVGSPHGRAQRLQPGASHARGRWFETTAAHCLAFRASTAASDYRVQPAHLSPVMVSLTATRRPTARGRCAGRARRQPGR